MPNKIQIKRTSVTGRTPNTTSSGNSSFIDTGELALNITDGKLFSSNGLVSFEVGANLNSLSVGGAKLTANATLVNAVALNVVNQTNTGTLFVTTSANVGTAFTANSSLVNAIALNVVNDLNVGGNISLGDSSSDSITINGTIQPGVVISGSANAAALRITQTSTGTGAIALRVEDETNPDLSPFMIDAQGRVRIGTNQEYNEKLVIFSNTLTLAEPSIVLQNQYPNANGPLIYLGKERNAGDVLTPGDDLGTIIFRGINENATQIGAQIKAETQTGVGDGAGYMPTVLRFGVATTNHDSDPVERLKIDSLGVITANANVQVIGTLAVANSAANSLSIGSSPWVIGGTDYDSNLNGISNVHAGFYRTLGSTETSSHSTGLLVQTKFSNVSLTQGKYHDGIRTYLMNESQNKNFDGSIQRQTQYYGVRSYVYNGNSSIGGDAYAQQLYGYVADVANYANGASANTVALGLGGRFLYSSRGSGITTAGYGVRSTVEAGNNSITGNITSAISVFAEIESNTAMTINEGILYYGIHRGSTTTSKYGLYLTGEGNNYLSGNVYVAGAIRPIGGIVANGSIGSAGQVLTSNSTGVYWSAVTGTAANPGGATTQVQFNDGGTFGATAGFTFNKTTNNVTVGNTITVGAVTSINSTTIALDSFGTTNGALITTTSIDVGNTTANAALDYNIIYVANNTSRANLTPTTLAIGSITVNSALANLQALNVVNQTNTGTLFVTTSANVASAFLVNSTGAYHTGTINAASHTVGTTTVINSTAISLGPFGTTNGTLITTTSIDVGNNTANAALDYNIIYVANSSSRANLTPTTLAIGSITVNSALANLQALNVVNQTNTATLYVTTSANVGTAFTANSTLVNAVALNVVNQTNTATLFVTTSANVASAFLANSTGAYHTGTINAASHTVGTNFTSNSSQLVLNAPSYTVSFSNTNGSATNYITWGQSLQQAIPATTTRSLGTKIIFYEGLSGSSTDWAYGLSGSEMWASVGTTTGTFRWYAVTTAFCTSNTSYFNHNAQIRVGGGVGTTNGATISNTTISVGNTVTNSSLGVSTLNVGTSFTVNSISVNSAVNTSIAAIIANGSIGTSGQVLTSNATGIYWSTVSGGGGSGASLAEVRKSVSLRI